MPTPKSNTPSNILNHYTAEELIEAIESRKKALTTPVECRQCRKEFVRSRSWQEFCSTTCKTAWHQHKRDVLVEVLWARVKELEGEVAEFRNRL
jgi:hypothetical protein